MTVDKVLLRNQYYKLGRFSDLHLAPIARFITDGIHNNPDSWLYAAKMVKKILPDIGVDLVDAENGEIYLSVKELQTVYQAALNFVAGSELATFSPEELEEDPNSNSDSDQVASLKQELALLRQDKINS